MLGDKGKVGERRRGEVLMLIREVGGWRLEDGGEGREANSIAN
jgi:hypothetical protein